MCNLKRKSFIGGEPFVITLRDDIIHNPKKLVSKQMIEKYELYGRLSRSRNNIIFYKNSILW